MGLKGGTGKSGGMGQKIAPGVFGKKGRISSITQSTTKQLGNYEPDLFLEITIDSGGQYPDVVNLFGNFSREQTGPDEYNGPIKGWGTAAEIDEFFQKFNIFEDMPEDEKEIDTEMVPVMLPQSWLDAITGSQIYYLLHASDKNPETGKPYYNAYKEVFPVIEDAPEEAEEAYNKIKGYLYSDDYAYTKLSKGRDALDESDNSEENQTMNTPTQPGSSSLDDDLPI